MRGAAANLYRDAESAPSCDRQRSWRCLRDHERTGFPQIRAVRAVRASFWLDGIACRQREGYEPATYGCRHRGDARRGRPAAVPRR